MIIRARSVVTMDGEPIDNGAVVISGDTITDVSRWNEVRARNADDVLDLGECVLMPGLINAHCHLDYTNLRRAIPRSESFTDWIRAINHHKAGLTPQDYLQSISDGLAEAARFGTTTIANLEAFPKLLSLMERPPPLRVWWFAEMIDVREDQSPAETYSVLHDAFCAEIGWLGGIGLAPHAPFTASRKLYAEAANVAVAHDLPLTTHLAESREEMAMFRDGSGSLCELMTGIGRAMDGKVTPLAFLLEQRLLDERWIVAHLNETTEDDLRLLKSAPKFHVVHCPRSHVYFRHSRFRFRELRKLGFNICLGTDSLASNEDLSLLAEMRQFLRTEPTLGAVELLEMATVNAAHALGKGDVLGLLRPGFKADMIALPMQAGSDDLLESIVAFEGSLPWAMVNGQLLQAT